MRAVERWDFSFGDIIVFDFDTILVKRIVKGEVSKRLGFVKNCKV